MTPLITEMVRLAPDPEQYNWFDVSALPQEQLVNLDVVNETPLPYKQCAVCGVQDNEKWLMILRQEGNIVAYIGWTMNASGYAKHPAFTYSRTPEGTVCHTIENTNVDTQVTRSLLASVGAWLQSLSPETVAHFPVAKKSLINSKRAARGKGPILFDWHTVKIEPPKRSVPMGGTHASPRRHQCRGHWRKHPTKGRVWIKDHWRGDAALGTVFKDYKVIE